MKFAPDQELKVNHDDVVWRSAGSDDEVVLLELSTSTYFTLNGSAKILWERLAGGASTDDLVADLVARFGISKDQARADTSSFLGELVKLGLVSAV